MAGARAAPGPPASAAEHTGKRRRSRQFTRCHMRIALSCRLQDYHVDTPGHRPTLVPYRGVPHERLRNRNSGDPLNLIRVMPAKGQEHAMGTSIFLAKLTGPIRLSIGVLCRFGYRH